MSCSTIPPLSYNACSDCDFLRAALSVCAGTNRCINDGNDNAAIWYRYLRAEDLASSNDDIRAFIKKTTPAAGAAAKY